MAIVRVDVKNLKWSVFAAKSGNWIGVCEPLKLTVQSETFSELMEDIGLTLNGLLRDLMASDELQRFLTDHGWTLGAPLPPQHEDVRFDVPFIPALLNHDPARQLHQ